MAEIDDFRIAPGDLSFVGSGLKRPECVLCTESGDIYVSRWGEDGGGVTRIAADGAQHDIIGRGAPLGTNGFAITAEGDFLVANLHPDASGAWRLKRDGAAEPFLTEIGGQTSRTEGKLPLHHAIVIGDRDIVTLDEAELRQLRRRRMSMVFQHFGLFAHRRVIDNVAYGLEVQGMARRSRLARAQDMIELVGLSGWEQHYPNQLSGGMQQRVGLARALTVDPDILLFDEPFSALDPLIRRELRSELVKLQQTMHKTIVFITHDFAEALELGERIAIMRDGQFVQIGSPEQLITAPADDYVSAFTRDVSRLTVLTVSSIMRDCEQVGQAVSSDESGTVLPAGTRLADALPALVERETPVLVANHDNNVVGCVDRAALVEALVANTSARSPNGRAESPAT